MEKCAVLLHGTFFNEFPFGKHVPLHNLLFFIYIQLIKSTNYVNNQAYS